MPHEVRKSYNNLQCHSWSVSVGLPSNKETYILREVDYGTHQFPAPKSLRGILWRVIAMLAVKGRYEFKRLRVRHGISVPLDSNSIPRAQFSLEYATKKAL